jgi:DNA-binding phage protein
VNEIPLVQDHRETIVKRVQRDAAFARALLDEAATLFVNGEPNTARLVLRDLVSGAIGFEALAGDMGLPSRSLRRMLSEAGNPRMDEVAAVLTAVRRRLGVSLEVRAVEAA